ncbi:MFS transporter [Arthrobacter sp. B2a2-09]|uniref:MFS transporter n=1 Tax=Arthrobacter sp. B2a2-09 TaxID=2952822 RepID=UPI0022CD733A|nr:MFS transporter [Arthrobacter sp. B2a2-09]MCZ9882289.1 MFS transporter [Arthrobacter sp. B2a2-09]
MSASLPESDSPLLTALGADALAPPHALPRVRPLFVTIYALALFGVWMAINLPATVTVALRVAEIDPAGKTTTYSIVAGIGTLAALLANPFFGQLSDRTRSRLGRRRPWIMVGLIGTAAGAAVIGFSDSIGLLIVGWVVMQAFINACIAAMLAIVADRVPENQQGIIGALSGTAASASTVVGVFFIQAFPTSILAQIGLPVVTALIFGAALVLIFKDDKPAPGERERFGFKEFFGSYYVNPRKSPDFTWFLGALFLVSIGFGVVMTYSVYFLQDQLHVSDDDLTNVLFVSLLLTGVLALVCAPLAGWLTDKIGRRKPSMIAAALLVAAGIALIVTAGSVEQFFIGMSLAAGVGAGIVYGVYIAFAVATLSDQRTVARDLGIVNIAFTLPFSIVPFAAPLILGIGGGSPNYVLLYIVGGAISLCSIPPSSRSAPRADRIHNTLGTMK